jgi:hypothetical protein
MTQTLTRTKPFSWSYSALKNFETCGLRHWHYDVLKDIGDRGENQYTQEGHLVHGAFDARLRKGVELPLGLGHYEPMLARLLAADGQTYSERKLAINSSYQPVAWFSDDAWYRGVLDCTKVKGSFATVLDWKTGKPSVDTTQLRLAAALVFHSAPAVQRVRAGLVFINHDRVESEEYVRADLTEIWGELLPRVRRLQQARETNDYQPRPGGLCRRWCQVTWCQYQGIGG